MKARTAYAKEMANGHKKHHCALPECIVCVGGLFECEVCGGAEGDLLTNCPGRKMTEEERDNVILGILDYRNGAWINLLDGGHLPDQPPPPPAPQPVPGSGDGCENTPN